MPHEAALGRGKGCRGAGGRSKAWDPRRQWGAPTMIWSHAGCDHGGLLLLPQLPVRSEERESAGGEGGRGGGGAGGGEGGCVRGLASMRGGGGAVSSAAERHRAADRGSEVAGAGQRRPGSPGRLWCGGGAVSDGARTPLGGDESRRAPSTGANPGGGGGSASPSPRGRTGPGRTPPDGYRGGGRGWVPGLWGPGPGSSRAGAGETGQALWATAGEGGGVGGPGWLGGEPREALGGWARAPEGGRSLGGGGGVAPCPGYDGGPSRRRGGVGACRPK